MAQKCRADFYKPISKATCPSASLYCYSSFALGAERKLTDARRTQTAGQSTHRYACDTYSTGRRQRAYAAQRTALSASTCGFKTQVERANPAIPPLFPPPAVPRLPRRWACHAAFDPSAALALYSWDDSGSAAPRLHVTHLSKASLNLTHSARLLSTREILRYLQ